jgi:ubiquinone/menaquinone biosynthesis C-methylase UbiE
MFKKNVIYNFYDKEKKDQPRGIMVTIHGLTFRFQKDRVESASELIPKYSDTLLDYGCNDGDFLKKNVKKFNRGIAVDISNNALKKAKENLSGSNIEFINGNTDEENLPILNETVDTVVTTDVIEHVFDPVNLIREFNRILKLNGTLIIATPNIAWLPHRISLLFGKRPRTSWSEGWDGGHISYFTFSDLKEVLKNLGFKVIKRTTGGSFWFLRTWWPSLLGANIVIKAKKIRAVNPR